MIDWSYGVTTCCQRVGETLNRTLASLADAGFDSPRIFVDGGCQNVALPRVTGRDSSIGAFGNWLLAAWELYIRQPQVRRYAIFQDDIVMCRGVKKYLEDCPYPEHGYLNLFTFATNEVLISNQPRGWYKSDQLGKGAVALVFDHLAMVTLLRQSHLIDKPQLPNGRKNVDGAIQHALVVQAGYTEYIHNPSLVQHIGRESTLDNHCHPQAKTFPGENWNSAVEMKR